MSPEFEAAWTQHAALSFEKQLRLADVVESRSWNFNMDSGQLTFGKKGFLDKPLVFDSQILGSASQGSSTWLWSYANESVDEKLTRASQLLRERGGLREFSTPQFPIDLDEGDEHRVAMTSVGILAGLSGCDAYYRGPFEGGAAFFLLRDARLQLGPPDALRLATVFPQLLSGLTLQNHRAAFLAYCEQREIEVQTEGDTLRARVGNSLVAARFDEANRLADLQVKAKA